MVDNKFSGNQKDAIEVLDNYIKEGSKEGLISALDSTNMDIRVKAIRGLLNLVTIEDVRALVDHLEENKSPIEGSEDATLNQIYKKELLDVLSNITHQDCNVNDLIDERQIDDVINRLRAWCKKNDNK